MHLAYPGGLGVKGFQMLIDIWLRIFLTRRGSDPTNLSRGTAFTNLIGSNTALGAAEEIVRTAITDCNEQVTALQRQDTTLSPRETLADARLQRFSSDPTGPGFEAYIEIMNRAGERLLINLPEYLNR